MTAPICTDYRAVQSERGYLVLYRSTGDNVCPGCGGRQWEVGRIMAECALCGTAIPLVSPDIPTPNNFEPERN